MAFRHPVDIANRACQHLGVKRISVTEGFTEDSDRASEMSFAYDKLRRAELRANNWKFSTRKTVLRPIDTTTLLIAPALWSSTTEYRPGAIVTDEGNTLWVSNFPDNLNNAPGSSYFWEVYTGSLTASPWDSTISYWAGEIVYTYPGDGTFKVYLSLENSNSDNPATGSNWDDEVTYMKDQVVTYLGTPFISLIDLNLNQTPSATPGAYASATTYASGATVYASDGYIYTSLQAGNQGHDPISSPLFWTSTGVLKPWASVFTGGTGSKKWLDLSPIAITDFFMIYPLGAGPSSQSATRNAYHLPAGFVRVAPQDPKAGSTSYLGAPSGLAYTDWDYEGDFFVSRDVDPQFFRFIADIQDVSKMDDLFCEALAARMAFETCQKLTQSTDKTTIVASAYKRAVDQARLTNAIEIGAIEPAEDDLIVCRR